MVQVHGILVDARHLKREDREVAFRQGLIPDVPGERTGTTAEE